MDWTSWMFIAIALIVWCVGMAVIVWPQSKKLRRKASQAEAEVPESADERLRRWNDQIDLRLARFGLDSDLPEVKELRATAMQYANSSSDVHHRLTDLLVEHVDPYYDVIHRDGVLLLHEGWLLCRILLPWTLVGYFYPSMPVSKMIVSKRGMSIYSGDQVIAWVGAAVVDPYRFDDDHRRLENTVAIVEHYAPNMSIKVNDLVGVYSAVFMKVDGEWTHHLSNAPETANIS